VLISTQPQEALSFLHRHCTKLVRRLLARPSQSNKLPIGLLHITFISHLSLTRETSLVVESFPAARRGRIL
jgi:hypothetical protein